jgi:hypothetical protein
MPTIAEVAATIFLWLRPCLGTVHASGLGLLVGQPNANLVSRPYLVKVLTRFVGMSKKCKIMLM